jgi:hypothetical protein
MQQRIDTLLRVEEEWEHARRKFVAHQQIVKKWFDKHKARDKNFELGDLVLKWDKINKPKGKHSKFQNLWLGPFQIAEKIGLRTYRLQNIRRQLKALPINGQALKKLFS